LFFTEPNLSFELVSAGSAVVVRLCYESSPPWISKHARLDGVPMKFPLATIDARAVAPSLRAVFERFPSSSPEEA
jgi:hypothetical protein